MKTWAIGSMGGQLCRGIPSEDSAVSIARDLLLYDPDYEDTLVDWNGYGPRPPWRQFVRIENVDEGLGPYILLYTDVQHRGYGVGPETERCDHCGRLPTPSLGGPRW